MGRIITVLLIGLAPLIVLGIRECAPTLPSQAPPPPPPEIILPADEPIAPLPSPPVDPEAPDEPSAR